MKVIYFRAPAKKKVGRLQILKLSKKSGARMVGLPSSAQRIEVLGPMNNTAQKHRFNQGGRAFPVIES